MLALFYWAICVGTELRMNGYFNPNIRMTTCTAARQWYWKFNNLSAPYWRLYWNRNTGGDVSLDGIHTPLTPEIMVLIPPNTPFHSYNSRVIEHLYIHFIAPPPYTTLPPSIFVIRLDPATQQRAGELFQMRLNNLVVDNRSTMLAFSLIHWALSHVPESLLTIEVLQPRLLAAIRLIEGSPDRPPSNTALAKALKMNTNAFIRLFKREIGISPQAYSLKHRIEQACLLLHNSTTGIKEIAQLTGFCDRYHFTRAFTRLRGISPAEFRRQIDPPPTV